MEPPKHKHKKVPRAPADDPVPVLHSPPRKVRVVHHLVRRLFISVFALTAVESMLKTSLFQAEGACQKWAEMQEIQRHVTSGQKNQRFEAGEGSLLMLFFFASAGAIVYRGTTRWLLQTSCCSHQFGI